MNTSTVARHISRLLVLAAFLTLGAGQAMAAPEPSLNQVYEAAQSGKMEQANQMMQQVLVAHPNSAKAHFVQAELSARQGQTSRAREELAIAERLAPGLGFAKPEAVTSLRAQLAGRANAATVSRPAAAAARADAPPMPAPSAFPWGMALALGAGALGLGMFLMRNKSATAMANPTAYPPQAFQPGGLSGPQNFGLGAAGPASAYGQVPAYGQAPGTGLGGRVMGGLATGLAVGAGVMAAQAIGKNLFGHEDHADRILDNPANSAVASNYDLGGKNFGVNDTSSWEDGGSFASSGDGGDWDS